MQFRLIAIICFLFAFQVFAQETEPTPVSNAALEIETLLNSNTVTYSQGARFALEASEAFITADPAEAFRYAVEHGWLSKKVSPDTAMRLDELSLLLMRSFDIKGGILYSITKNSHFAYRELVYKNIIQGRADPSMSVSGENLLFITNKGIVPF